MSEGGGLDQIGVHIPCSQRVCVFPVGLLQGPVLTSFSGEGLALYFPQAFCLGGLTLTKRDVDRD